jgi:hypothetical protein
VGEDVFAEAVGPDYDATDLFRWLRSEGKAMLAEVTDARFVRHAVRKGRAGAFDSFNEEADILARHGLALRVGGKWLDGDGAAQAVEDYCVAQIMRGVRVKKSGATVDRATAAVWLREVMDRSDKNGEKNRFEKAAERVIDRKYQGQEVLHQRLLALQVRVCGLYRGSLIPAGQGLHVFRCTLMMPGVVAETNGQILGDHRVRWQFGAEEAYPLGYEMACSSLEAQAQVQKELLKGQPLADREALLEFVNEVAGNEKLTRALAACRKQNSMAPLYELRKEKVEVDRLLRLLKLPLRPA